MKNSITLLLLLFISTFIYAQNSELRDLPTFDGISLTTSGNVYLTQGNAQKVEIKGREETLRKIETEVRSGTLVIKHKDSDSWFGGFNSDDFDVYITVKNLKELNVSGSGRIMGKNKFAADRMEIEVSGSGRISLETSANLIETSISGSGKIELKGTTKDLETRISGSGTMYAEDMECENFQARISGSGKCEVNVSKSLDARISGSGSVYYRGNPDKINSQSSGSGKVRKVS
ncbi:MAG TPA: head GIN domain-containing protein [Fulvivirga sp.]|nr:head GIN domain-containing protein [Fulvivirga sp.]